MDLDNDDESEKHSKTKKKLVQKNKNEDLLPNYIFKLSEKASDNDYKNNLYHCLEFVVEQLDSYKKKIDILGENEADTQCELIPTNTNDMNILKDEDVKNILFSIGFYFNNDTEYITLEKDKIPEIELISQKIINFKNIIDENIEIDKNEIERNQQKENYVKMQKKKHNNSKKLRDYIMTEEEAAKEREKEIEKIEKENDFVNEDFVIKSKKKKKKLIKKNRELDLIKEEDEIEEKSKSNSGNKKDVIDDK